MNITPIMPENFTLTYTVLGGSPQGICEDVLPVTMILLPRGPKPLQQITLEAIKKAGFYHIILVMQEDQTSGWERLSTSYPGLRIIVCKDIVLPGALINIALYEACTRYGLVMWNDMQCETPGFSQRFFEKIDELKACCIVPHIVDVSGVSVPSLKNPVRQKKHFRIVSLTPEDAIAEKSLYPHDYCGLYDREKFLSCGGYNTAFSQSYYQLADFGMRAWLWGHSIIFNKTLKMKYTLDIVPEDTTLTKDYYLFWIHNIAPHYVLDHAELEKRHLLSLMLYSRMGLGNSLKLFSRTKQWVERYKYHFKMDAVQLVDLWEPV